MRNALLEVKRPILYSLCEWGSANVQTWGNDTAHSWRSTGDIEGKPIPLIVSSTSSDVKL